MIVLVHKYGDDALVAGTVVCHVPVGAVVPDGPA